ncbi:MAG: DNA-processing protein DprA [Pseudanabaena sp. ELA607]
MERAYWLAWSQMPGVGSVICKRIAEHFPTMAAAWAASGRELQQVEGIGNQNLSKILQERQKIDPRELYASHLQDNPDFWTPADPNYPKLLWEIPDPPAVLYYRGNVTQWNERYTVAIVGTRQYTPYGKRWTEKISAALAQAGFVVVSGMADGIDGVAHGACLGVGGATLAVLGTGVDRIYPHKHTQLYRDIIKNGLVLSEYPKGTEPSRSQFPQRNRIIAGLCRFVLVMEAGQPSGALITAYRANDYGRDVMALPNSLDVAQARGCLNLIAKGAQPILGVDELLAAVDAPKLSAKNESMGTDGNAQQQLNLILDLGTLEPLQQKIMQHLSFSEGTTFDQLMEKLQLPAGDVMSGLLQLELQQYIEQEPIGSLRYQRLR